MKLPQYVTLEEVQRVCHELNLSDWTAKKAAVSVEEAQTILDQLDVQGMDFTLEDFRQGLEVELEHGLCFDDSNVTNNHPVLTGKIVLAHFKESTDYYRLLDVAEIEGDLDKAILAGNIDKAKKYYPKLLRAQITLHQAQLARFERGK